MGKKINALDLTKKQPSRQYAASKTTHGTGAWNPPNTSQNEEWSSSMPSMRNRSRQMERDYPHYKNGVDKLADFVVGAGIGFQARVRAPNGELNERVNQEIEDQFSFWMDEADFSGKLHYNELMRLAKNEDSRDGEFIFIERFRRDRRIPYCLQSIEPEQMTDMGVNRGGKNTEILQGVEYSKKTGERLFYHFVDPDGWGKSTRVRADQVIHGFETRRGGLQLRGVSPMVTAIRLGDTMQQFLTAELNSSKMASKWLATRTSMDGGIGRQMSGSSVDNSGPTPSRVEELMNGIIEYQTTGQDIQIIPNRRQGPNFQDYGRFMLCMYAVAVGLPYPLLTGDYSGSSWSTMKVERNDFKAALAFPKFRHVKHFCVPTHRGFMRTAVMSGKLNLPGYFVDEFPYLRSEWQPPEMASVNPLQDTKAHADEIALGLRSQIEIIRARGGDPATVIKESAQFRDWMEDAGLSVEQVSTASANNPAAVENQDNGKRGLKAA